MIADNMISLFSGTRICASFNASTSLHEAARFNDCEEALHLIYSGASINAVDMHGRTPLSYAVMNGHQRIIDLLLLQGADASLLELVLA